MAEDQTEATDILHNGDGDDMDIQFGWRSYRPKLLQVMRRPWLFFFVLLTCVSPQVVMSDMLPYVLRTLTTRFNLSKKDTEALTTVRVVFAMLSAVVMGYLGNSRNKVRWISAGMAMAGLGAILFAMPHYDIAKYSPVDLPPFVLRRFGLCMASVFPCSTKAVAQSHMALFVIGQILIGAGLGPLYTLVPAYIDENVSPRYMPVYIMLYYTNLFVAPIIGMLISQMFLGIYVEIKKPSLMLELTHKDFRWIGAWWLPYLIIGVLMLFYTLLFLSFPKRLPGSRARTLEGMQEGLVPRVDPKITRSPTGIFYATTSLLKNKVFLFNTLALCCLALLLYSMGPFLFRFVMIKYAADPEEIGMSAGAVLIFGSLVGLLIGGLAIKRVSLTNIVRGAAFVCLITEAICLLTPLLFVLPGCSESNIAGVSIEYPPLGNRLMPKQNGSSELTTACNARCRCNTVFSQPVCGSNNVAYFDPCHAGCLARPTEKNFANCTCIPPTRRGYMGGEAKLGYCDRGCKSLSIFLFGMFVALVIFGANFVPNKIVVLRCVAHNQRSYALAVQTFLFLLIGFVPSRLVRYIMDKDCNVWQTDPCGHKGICWDYKAESMSKSMSIFGFLVIALSLIFYFLSWYCCEKPESRTNNNALLNSNGIVDDTDKETDL